MAKSNNEAAKWSLILEPRAKTGLHLKSILRYRDLIKLFVKRNYTTYYKQTILGPAWFIINPVLTVLMFTIVFGGIANTNKTEIPSFLFFMAGNILWAYFSACVNNSANTFIQNSAIFGKVYFPRIVMPISNALFSMISMGIQLAMFVILYVIMYFTGSPIQPSLSLLLIPVLIVITMIMSVGVGIIISALTTKYRDLNMLVSFGVQLWMYASSVVYQVSSIQNTTIRTLMMVNPVTPIIETFRYAWFGSAGGYFNVYWLLYSTAFAGLVFTCGLLLFNKVEKTFMDTV